VTPALLALVLGSAVLHATWNLWAKQIGGAARRGTLMWVLVTLSALVYAVPALSHARTVGFRLDAPALALIVASGAVHVGYFLCLLKGYRRADFSVVYPLARGTGPVLAGLAALVVFDEPVTAAVLFGIGCIGAGVLVLSGPFGSAREGRLAAGLTWGMATGGLIAVYTLLDGWAVKRGGIPPLVFYWAGEVVRVVMFTPVALADRAGVVALARREPWRVLGIGLLSPLSYMLILVAMQLGPVSHIAPAREVGILVGAWLGGSVLGEQARRRRLLAAALFVGGVLALAWG
jgi:multidrug transporter EmrE-like cation transporter